MPTSTLHLNNPVPSNGAVVSSLGGRHTVTVTLAGVGAISCVVQAWGSEQGTDSRKIGAPVTVSGTTTVSQTLTFDADCKQFWLEIVKLSPACKFNATVENDGTIAMSGPLRVAGELVADSASFDGPVRAARGVSSESGLRLKTRLGRRVRVITFGHSIDHIYSSTPWNVEAVVATIPGGATSAQPTFSGTRGGWLHQSDKIHYIGDHGASGATTADMLARSDDAASATRRSIYDAISQRPDICFFALRYQIKVE